MRRPKGEARQLIIEALEHMQKEGATRDEIITLQKEELVSDVRHSYGKVLSHMLQEGEVEIRRGKYFLTRSDEAPPAPSEHSANAHENGQRIILAPHQAGRAARSITVYSDADEYEDVIQATLFFAGGGRFNLPLAAGSYRIAIGNGRPKWSVYQETIKGVSSIRIVYRDGRNIDIPVDSQKFVTYDLEGE